MLIINLHMILEKNYECPLLCASRSVRRMAVPSVVWRIGKRAPILWLPHACFAFLTSPLAFQAFLMRRCRGSVCCFGGPLSIFKKLYRTEFLDISLDCKPFDNVAFSLALCLHC